VVSALQIREIFHFCFLERLLRVADSALFVLKGGVNLRFFFHSPRYSEDMDLNVLGGQVEPLRKNGYKILKDPAFRRTLQSYGIADVEINDPTKAKHTETTQRLRVHLVTTAGERFLTKIECSRRKTRDMCVNARIDPDIAMAYNRLSFRCQHYPGEVMVVQKVHALADRTQTQARDVFDLHLLSIGGHVHDRSIVSVIPRQVRQKAQENLLLLQFDDCQGHVVEFLDEEQKVAYDDHAVWDSLQHERLTYITYGL
jgi:predicted nucleotidyltransferase component of viral defense system